MKVRYTEDGDDYTITHRARWGGNDDPRGLLETGRVYTLAREPEVHSWHTKYELVEFPGKKFNSTHFEVVCADS